MAKASVIVNTKSGLLTENDFVGETPSREKVERAYSSPKAKAMFDELNAKIARVVAAVK